jgi:hypothetical protein
VLCGTSPARRQAYARHLEATERRFYEERQGGVEDLVEWHARHDDEPAWSRAAGAYFDPSTVIRNTAKNSPAMLFRLPGIRKRLAALLQEHADRRHLLGRPGASLAQGAGGRGHELTPLPQRRVKLAEERHDPGARQGDRHLDGRAGLDVPIDVLAGDADVVERARPTG